MIQTVRFVFITVVGPQVEVSDDLHLLGKRLEDILLKGRVACRFDGFEVELGA